MEYKKEIIDKLTVLGDDASWEDIKKTVNNYAKEKELEAALSIFKSHNNKIILRVASTLCLFSLIIILFSKNFYCGEKCIDIGIYVGWLLIPPVWFLYEYVTLFPDASKIDTIAFADFKYCQELAGKIWAALAIIFSAIIYLKYAVKI